MKRPIGVGGMRLPKLPAIPREVPYALAGILALYSVLAAATNLPLLFGLSTEALLILGMLAVVAASIGIVHGQRREIAALRRIQDEGAVAFGARLTEGNRVAAHIRRWPRIQVSGSAPERRAAREAVSAERAAEYKQRVAEWNAACVDTVRDYLPLRLPDFERAIKYASKANAAVPLGVLRLREEVEQRYERMVALRDEYEARRTS